MSVDDIVQQIDQTDGFPELPSLAMEIAIRKTGWRFFSFCDIVLSHLDILAEIHILDLI